MRFPTAMLFAAVMLGTTMTVAPQASAVFPCDATPYNGCCNVDPTYLYCAFDNHIAPDFGVLATAPDPSPLGGCSFFDDYRATIGTKIPQGTPLGQFRYSPFGGCLYVPVAAADGLHTYHANIAAGTGADDFLWGDAQVCFFDAALAPIVCHGGFTADDLSDAGPCIAQGTLDPNTGSPIDPCYDDSITQLAKQHTIPAGSAYFDIEYCCAPNVISAFWVDA